MTTHAYSEFYLSDAKRHLAVASDCAVHSYNVDIDQFFNLFILTGFADRFAQGDPMVVAGMSGQELVREVLRRGYGEPPMILPLSCACTEDRTPEFWLGWVLAEYQWHSGLSFKAILDRIKPSELVCLYPIHHEMDITQLYATLNEKMADSPKESRLKAIREASGLSQAALAKKAGVGLRSIQMYEQGVNDINKAQVRTLRSIARTLGCRIDDLLQPE